MPVLQMTPYGPKPVLTTLAGRPSGLATPSVPLGTYGRGLTMTGGRPLSFAAIYRTQPMVASAANVLIRQVARLPLHAFQYVDSREENRQRVKTHGAAQVLNRPRPRRRGTHLRAELALSIFVHGTYVGWKRRTRRGAPPAQLWSLDWRCLIPRGEGGVVEAWEWTGRGVPDVPRFIDPADVVVVGWNSPEGEVGVSPLEQLGVTVRSEEGLQTYGDSIMRNGTRMGVAAILDKSVSADKAMRDGVREELMDVHGGVFNVGKPAVLGGGIVDLKPIGHQSAVEAALIEQRKVNREEIAAVYGVPQPMAGILDHGTYSNVAELHRVLYVTVLGAHLSMIAESIQAQLLDDEPAWDPDGVFLEFDLSEVLKGDTMQRMAAYAIAIQNGILTLNDVRRLENRKPYDDERANEPLIAANNVRPLSAVGQGTGGNDATGQQRAEAFVRLLRAAGADETVIAALTGGVDLERILVEGGALDDDTIAALIAGRPVDDPIDRALDAETSPALLNAGSADA